MRPTEETFRLGLVGLFVVSLITAQFLAVKILVIPLPVTLPLIGEAILVPAGVIAIAVTFLATDCYTELYGARAARRLVNIGFATLFVMLVLLWLAILAPGSPDAGVDPDLFAAVLAPSTNIVLGGLLAYIVSQHWDVFAFHRIREWSGTRWLWLRNLASTGTSQLIDTTIFILVAFWLAPVIAGIGAAESPVVLLALILGHYLVKVAIAILDTPFVYGIVGYARSQEFGGAFHPLVD